MTEKLTIGERTYENTDGVYEIPAAELGDLKMGEIPAHSTVQVIGLPDPPAEHEFHLTATNGGRENQFEYLTIFGGAYFNTNVDSARRMNRIRRTYLPFVERGELPEAFVPPTPGLTGGGASFDINLAGQPDAIVAGIIEPLIRLFERLAAPEASVFICHASEDKPFARDLAVFLDKSGADVWLDEWEIRVGESIVEKINSELASASHLVVLLSSVSVDKPWVKKEMSVALMRQLSDRSVIVLPVLVDDCVVPSILSDVKYADCRVDVARGLDEVKKSVFSERLRGCAS